MIFKGGTIATGELTWIGIPGSRDQFYSGTVLAEYYSPAQTSDGTILASGQRFALDVFTKTSLAPALGFDLTYMQAPCTQANKGDF